MKEPPTRIAITGAPAAGKTELAGLLAERAIHVIDVGDALAERLTEHGVAVPSRAHIGPLFLQQFGVRAVFEVMRPHIVDGAAVALDAVRASTTVNQLCEWDPSFRIVHVEAPERLRLERLHDRVSTWSHPADAERAYDALSFDTDWCRARADFVIRNDGTTADLRAQVERLMRADNASR